MLKFNRFMNINFTFFFTSFLLGTGLAMDAFSVSLANGMNEPNMKKRKMYGIAGVFELFQFAMPLFGWICVSSIAHKFCTFKNFIPWIAFFLLSFIGGKMLYESIVKKQTGQNFSSLSFGILIVQGIATSLDALSVGFTISNYSFKEAFLICSLIGLITFFICFAGLAIGKKAGTKLADKAGIFGGIILIAIGLKIFITSFF